jgi:integrase
LRTGVALGRNLELVLKLLTPGNRLVARVMLCTGLRVGDVVGLTRDQIRPALSVTEAKTGKRRRVRIPQALCDEVLKAAGRGRWAFPSPSDPAKHRTRQAVWADIKRAQRACRLRANLGTHSMRKAYAVRLMGKYHDLARVQRALGHERPEVTLIYAMADQLMGRAGR